jgi:hypothetical protein
MAMGLPSPHTPRIYMNNFIKIENRNPPPTKNKGLTKKISTKNLENQGVKVKRV